MSNLIKFLFSSGTPVLIDPRIIRSVEGNNLKTEITLDSKDPETGDYIVHIIPKSVKEVTKIIEDKFIEIKADQILEQGNQDH